MKRAMFGLRLEPGEEHLGKTFIPRAEDISAQVIGKLQGNANALQRELQATQELWQGRGGQPGLGVRYQQQTPGGQTPAAQPADYPLSLPDGRTGHFTTQQARDAAAKALGLQ